MALQAHLFMGLRATDLLQGISIMTDRLTKAELDALLRTKRMFKGVVAST